VYTIDNKGGIMRNQINLSPRFREIVIGISYGKTRKQIAYETGLSLNTIKTYITRLYQKLGAVNAPEAVRIVFENKLIPQE
jgi:DNA-binding NarL/FixJ family response regulator